MKIPHFFRDGERKALHYRALKAALGCIIYITFFLIDNPCSITLAYATKNEPCNKTAISLNSSYLEAESAFQKACSKCHDAPNPSEPSCATDLNEEDLTAVWNYMHEMKDVGTAALDCLESEGSDSYENHCSKCHALPEPAKPNCLSETPLPNLIKAHSFMESVREGKALYDRRCNSCHASIEPSRHGFDFWKKHLCVEAAALEPDEAQKVLLYLKAAAQNKKVRTENSRNGSSMH